MGEPTMEEYMTKTREDYGSRIPRPKFDKGAKFELKGQFLKELRDNTFSGSKNEDANEHIKRVLGILRNEPAGSITTWEIPKGEFLSKYCPPACTANKMEEINNFQQELDETLYQAWERFKELLLRCPQHYLTNMEFPSIDEPKPQPQPLCKCPSLDVSLGDERDPEPPIKPLSPNSFRMKVVYLLTIHTPPLPHVASFHPKDTYCYNHPCISNPNKHYEFKPGLLGQSGSQDVDFSNMEMIENDWEL
ncbi:hypothetical protein Tco_0682242 [Tanacetum coccineum]|uniref:Retrotransposon gag domain-containing protein n=1 Tax=Tanacetum coccineum TaxID=301880 RepID=A0ABQ4XS85_9ASTR